MISLFNRIAGKVPALLTLLTLSVIVLTGAVKPASAQGPCMEYSTTNRGCNISSLISCNWPEIDKFDGYGPHDGNGYHTRWKYATIYANGVDKWMLWAGTGTPWTCNSVLPLTGTNIARIALSSVSQCKDCKSTLNLYIVCHYDRINVVDITKPTLSGDYEVLWQSQGFTVHYSNVLDPQPGGSGGMGPHTGDPNVGGIIY